MAHDQSGRALAIEFQEARKELTATTRILAEDLNVAKRARIWYKKHWLSCVAGAITVGLLVAWAGGRRRKPEKTGGLFQRKEASTTGKAAMGIALLSFVADLAKPALTAYIRKSFFTPDSGR
ncbi:MAG: hypothetical protein M3463_10770 [Verrucomicrobiota bacterium]|nr:hypothetical protein [Verrucomicrobiota bacterium]